MTKGDVVQFNENHKWCGSLGIITKVKDCKQFGIKYQVVIDVPQEGAIYTYVMSTENAIERIGQAKLVPNGE